MKKKRNKKYSPKPSNKSGGLGVLSYRSVADEPLAAEYLQDIAIDYYNAIEMMAHGVAGQRQYDALVYACNIGRILADNGLGSAYDAAIQDAMQGMQRCRKRYDTSGKFGLDGDALKAMRAFGPVHDAQMEIATASELEAAITEMNRQVYILNEVQHG